MARSVDDFVIDFSKEEKGGGGIRIKPGTYRVKVMAAKPVESKEKGTPGLELKLKFMSGPKTGTVFTETLYATPKAYSRFRALLEALGKKVPGRVNLVKIASAVKGGELYVEMDDEVREGYGKRSRVTFEGFMSEDDYEDGDDDADDEDDDELEDDDLDEEDDDLDDDEEEDEDDEPEPPKRKRRSAAKKPPARKRKRRSRDDDEDDDDLDLEDL